MQSKAFISTIIAIFCLNMPIITQAGVSCDQELLQTENLVSSSVDFLSDEVKQYGLWHILEVAAGREGLYSDNLARQYYRTKFARFIANKDNYRRPRRYDGVASSGPSPHQQFLQRQKQARNKLLKRLGIVGTIAALGAGAWSLFSSSANGATLDELSDEAADIVLESIRAYDTSNITIIDTPIEELERLLMEASKTEVLQTICKRPSISSDITALAMAYAQNTMRIQQEAKTQ